VIKSKNNQHFFKNNGTFNSLIVVLMEDVQKHLFSNLNTSKNSDVFI